MELRCENPKSSLAAMCARTAAILALVVGTALAAGDASSSKSSGSSFATTGGDPFALGEKVAFAGLSVGTFGVYGNTTVPPLEAGFDFAFHQYMTIGGLFAYSRYDYLSESLTYLTFAARGTFHPTMWLTHVKVPIDPYGIATVGYTMGSYSGAGNYNYSYPVIAPGVGIRYWFMPNLSGFAETSVGAGANLGSIGLALKL